MKSFKNISKRFLIDFCNDCSCATIVLANDRRNIIDVVSKLKFYITSGVDKDSGVYAVNVPNGTIYAKNSIMEVIAMDSEMACIKFNILNANRRSQSIREIVETIIYNAVEQLAEDLGEDAVISLNLCYLNNSAVHETVYSSSKNIEHESYWAYSLGYYLGKSIDVTKKEDMKDMAISRLSKGDSRRRLTWLHHVISGVNMNPFHLSEVLNYTMPECYTLEAK